MAKANLRQAVTFAHQNRKRARADVRIKGPSVTCRDAIKTSGVIGNDGGEEVEATSGAFRIGGGGDGFGQPKPFDERDDVDTARLQDGAIDERYLVQLQFLDARGDGGLWTGQKARAHAVSHCAETQVETRRLNLVMCKITGAHNGAVASEGSDHAVRQNAFFLAGD